MSATPSLAATLVHSDRLDLRNLVLVAIICMMFGGVFQTLVTMFGENADRAIWILLWVLLATFWVELPVFRLLAPAAPLLVWMLCYVGWGVMAADYPVLDKGYRLLFRFGSVATAMMVVTSRPRRLRVFANTMQWMLVVNLAFTLLLMTRPEYQSLPYFAKLNVDMEADRFAGLWGNANQAGLDSLIVLALSAWASRGQAAIGRACGLAIIYLTASRTAAWILVALVLWHLVFVASPKVRLKALGAVLVLALGGLLALRSSGTSLQAVVADNPIITRLLDVTESRTAAETGGSRLGVLKTWLQMVPAEPWYGYGLNTLYGGESDQAVPRPGFPVVGPHNLYLGLFLDVGALGLLSFLVVIARQLNRIRHLPMIPAHRRALLALCVIVLMFSNFNHNMLSDEAGWIAYSLMFLLPAAPALAGWEPAPEGDPSQDRR